MRRSLVSNYKLPNLKLEIGFARRIRAGTWVSLLWILLAGAFPAAQAQLHPGYNYEEKDVHPYTLPDPLTLANGKPVRNRTMWYKQRRPEILQLFEQNVYGHTPAHAQVPLRYKVEEAGTLALNGTTIRRQVTIYFTGNGEAGPKMHLLVYLPATATKPVPLILGLNFQGNQTVSADPGIILHEIWLRDPALGAPYDPKTPVKHTLGMPAENSRGRQSQEWQVEEVVRRGYGLATAYYGDIEPDFAEGMKYGVRPLFFRQGQTEPGPDEWGAVGAWAWGLSQALDYLLTDKHIDGHKVAVTGHSRLGKTADWAAAQDTRFTALLSTESGKGGQSLYRRNLGENIGHLVDPYGYWFCRNFRQWVGRDSEIPVDGNLLLSLIAPRPLYVASAEDDRWSDPRGEFLSAADAGRVYQLLGKQGLGTDQMPAVDHPIMHTIAYHVRTGKHDVTAIDWQHYLDFLDAQWGVRK